MTTEQEWLAKELGMLDLDEDDTRLMTQIVELGRELLHGATQTQKANFRDMVVRLVEGKNVAPLTDDPQEWTQATPSLWQNNRNPDGYSNDGGRTHWFLSERKDSRNQVYTSVHYTPPPLPPEPDPVPDEVVTDEDEVLEEEVTNEDPEVQP